MLNSSPIVFSAGFTGNWWVEFDLGPLWPGLEYTAFWVGNIILQPQPIEPSIFLQIAQTQLIQIENRPSDLGFFSLFDQTTQLQIQITNTGGPIENPGSSVVSFNLWTSLSASETIGSDVVLGPGQTVLMSVVFPPGSVGAAPGTDPDPGGGWPGVILSQPQPLAPSFGVQIPNSMTAVEMNLDGNYYLFSEEVQNTDPSNGDNPVSFILQSASYASGIVGGAADISLAAGGTFVTGVAYSGTGWPGNVLVQPEPFGQVYLPYSMIGVMQDEEGTIWFYIEVQNTDPSNQGYFIDFALQSALS